MNIILVPTNFSPAADNATLYAAQLAQQTGCELHLINAYQVPVMINDIHATMPAIALPVEELRKTAEKQLKLAKEEVAKTFPELVVKTEALLSSSVEDEVADYGKEKSIFAVVVGNRQSHGIENWFGSTVTSLIKHSRYPVIAVPEGYTKTGIQRLALATDLSNINEHTKTKITSLVQKLGAILELVHVQTRKEETDKASNAVQQFSGLSATFKNIESDNVTTGLNHYLQQSGTDLLIILPHHHSLWESWFSKQHTKELLSGLHIPILSIPERG